MYLSDPTEFVQRPRQRRRTPRLDLQCRARIRIGDRQYAGYIHDISRGGAKLRTISPIRKLGTLTLLLPDLPPLRCRLVWTNAYNAGLAFETSLSAAEFRRWAEGRTAMQDGRAGVEYGMAELVESLDQSKDAIE